MHRSAADMILTVFLFTFYSVSRSVDVFNL